MAKVIAKLHANGNFETVGVQLVQDGNSYSFAENVITVPKIIEYPPVGYRNYFIEKDSVIGFLSMSTGEPTTGVAFDSRTSDFINVLGWGLATIRIEFNNMNSDYVARVGVYLYDTDRNYYDYLFDEILSVSDGNHVFEFQAQIRQGVQFVRVCANYYDKAGTNVRISVEKGTVATQKHYLAFEDMPSWVVDTGQPISIFKEGIVIKGDLIQS